MKKIAIVSCDKWINVLEEDKNLKKALNDIGLETDIISWQQPFDKEYDLLVIRSIWGYQNYYEDFKKWLLYVKKNNILVLNDVDMILNNIKKDVQFDTLKKYDIDCINTKFITKENVNKESILNYDGLNVIKPSISGSGENTFIISNDKSIKNSINIDEAIQRFKTIINDECKIMIQPYIKEINDGEYSCIFIDGKLTHTMLRFPNIFHDKKRPHLITDVPKSVIDLAKNVEQINAFNGYLYMRVDMVMVDNKPKIMEVELTDPDLLTKYIEDQDVKEGTIKTLAKSIKGRVL